MPKNLYIDASHPNETRVVLKKDNHIEDYEYESSSGDLDEYNGRYCITPEYPNGTYAYFVTIDTNLDPVYPYTPGPYYYGVAQGGGNLGLGSGHNTIPNNCTPYTGSTTNIMQIDKTIKGEGLIQVIDLLGRKIEKKSDSPLLYIYQNGIVEKIIIID